MGPWALVDGVARDLWNVNSPHAETIAMQEHTKGFCNQMPNPNVFSKDNLPPEQRRQNGRPSPLAKMTWNPRMREPGFVQNFNRISKFRSQIYPYLTDFKTSHRLSDFRQCPCKHLDRRGLPTLQFHHLSVPVHVQHVHT